MEPSELKKLGMLLAFAVMLARKKHAADQAARASAPSAEKPEESPG
jgi:hypothetical protein